MPNVDQKTSLTTGQVAGVFNVSNRLVQNWIDAGLLRGYRLPGSRDRRVLTTDLVRFALAHDLPLELLRAAGLATNGGDLA